MKRLKRFTAVFLVLVLLISTAVLSINSYVISSQKEKILSADEASLKIDIPYIMVLGCGIIDGKPSAMLEDRLLKALDIAERLPRVKLILTGNNSGEEYNEVGVMKEYCISMGLPKERIITDDFGFSTGESVENLNNVIKAEKVIIVTQKYHLYRALYIAEQFGIEAFGVASNQHRYKMQLYYSLREIAARNKDFLKYISV